MPSSSKSFPAAPDLLQRGLALAFALALLSACATSDFDPAHVLRPAEGGPQHFVVSWGSGPETPEAAFGDGCRSPMIDPRDGTRLKLVRSSRDQGDYTVPLGMFGVGEDELLRIDCATGEPIGIVKP